MPRRDAHDSEFGLVHGLNLDRFEDGSSATRPEPEPWNSERLHRINKIRAAIAEMRQGLTLRERAVLLLRIETTPPWSQADIATLLHIDQSQVSRCEMRLVEMVRVLVVHREGE